MPNYADKAYQADIKQFIKLIEIMDSSKDTTERFRDFCEMAYCALAKPVFIASQNQTRADELEARYMKVVGRYERRLDDIRETVPHLLALVQKWAPEYADFLGDAAAEMGKLSSEMGQFFTPISVSRLLSDLVAPDDYIKHKIERNGYITFHEPAAGAGAMILSFARRIKEVGYNPMIHMLVQANDISNLAYQMCYIQLSLAGIPACVHRADTLRMEEFEAAWTIGALFFHDFHGHLEYGRGQKQADAIEKMLGLIREMESTPAPQESAPLDENPVTRDPLPLEQPEPPLRQLSLF